MEQFTRYMLDFYGVGGIYDYGFTAEQVNLATKLYKVQLAEGLEKFEGDTVDRENVRDLILKFREVAA